MTGSTTERSFVNFSGASGRSSVKSPGIKRVDQLDFVRGLAILTVMEFHFKTVPTHNPLAVAFEWLLKRCGWVGVDLFFVLSGFLVGGLLVQELLKSEHIQIRRFLVRRAFKIWPAYYAYLLVQVVARKHPLHTFFWQNFLNIQNYAGTTLDHTWSLAVEEHFYLLLPPLLLWLYKRAPSRIPMVLASICFAVLLERIVIVYGLGWGNPGLKTHARIDSLLFGVMLSWFFYTNRPAFDRFLRRKLLLCAVTLTGLAFIVWQSGADSLPMASVGYTLNYLSLGSLLLLIYSYRGRFTKSALYQAIRWIGIYSYGIYLWHLSVREPIAHAVTHLPVGVRWTALFLGQYAAAIALGVLMTKLVEFPMLRAREHLFPRGEAKLAPVEP